MDECGHYTHPQRQRGECSVGDLVKEADNDTVLGAYRNDALLQIISDMLELQGIHHTGKQ